MPDIHKIIRFMLVVKNFLPQKFRITPLFFFFLAFIICLPSRASNLEDISKWEQELDEEVAIEAKIEISLKIARAYTALGKFDLARFYLERVLPVTEDNSLKAKLWAQLGNIASRSGELDEGMVWYEKSLALTPSISTYNNLAILYQKQVNRSQLQAKSARQGREQKRYQNQAKIFHNKAISLLEQAATLSNSLKTSNASSVRTLIELGKLNKLDQEQKKAVRARLNSLSPSRMKVFLMINWSKLDSYAAIAYWLEEAHKVALDLGEEEVLSYVLLEQALQAESLKKFVDARKYAIGAIKLATNSKTDRSLYQAQWLMARLSQTRTEKLNYYQQAISSLDKSLAGFGGVNDNFRLDFQNKVEPLYRETLGLLLEAEKPERESLLKALAIFDKLQLARLQSYFGDDCFVFSSSEKRDSKNILQREQAVLLTSILLENESHFILQLPDGTLDYSKSPWQKSEITELATAWYGEISNSFEWDFWDKSQKLYDLLLRPFEERLTSVAPRLIIFVNDGVLRNIPVAALHDGEKFVAQKWAISNSLGLNFNFVNSSNSRENGQKKTVAFGLETQKNGWAALENVEEELENVVRLSGNGKILLDQDFTSSKFQRELMAGYGTVHLATHGYFGGVAENSFLLAYDRPLSALDLEKALLNSPESISLLVLSACETALSSDRSLLGLAGLALRTGVESVLGTYWQVQDEEQLDLMSSFYRHLPESEHTAIAVQKVQQKQIETLGVHPSSWAALNLIESF